MIEEENQENLFNLGKDDTNNRKINKSNKGKLLLKKPKIKRINSYIEQQLIKEENDSLSQSSDFYLSENNINKEELDIYKNNRIFINENEIIRKLTQTSQKNKNSFYSSNNNSVSRTLSFPITNNSKVFINPFDEIESNNIKPKFKNNNNDAIFPKIKKLLLLFEIIIGFCSIFLSAYILIIISEDSFK